MRNRRLRTGAIAVVAGGVLLAVGSFSAYTELEGHGGGGSVQLGISAGVMGLVLVLTGIVQVIRAMSGDKMS